MVRLRFKNIFIFPIFLNGIWAQENFQAELADMPEIPIPIPVTDDYDVFVNPIQALSFISMDYSLV